MRSNYEASAKLAFWKLTAFDRKGSNFLFNPRKFMPLCEAVEGPSDGLPLGYFGGVLSLVQPANRSS